MVKRDISELAIYHIYEELDTLSLECLRSLYLEKTSEIVYILKDEKLYGIVCMGEALYGHKHNGQLKINKSFTTLEGYDIFKAHEIFKSRRKVHQIPVVTEQGELLGDYSRWDDKLFIERNHRYLMKEGYIRQILESYDTVYVIKPVESKNAVYLYLINYLSNFHISYLILDKCELFNKMSENAVCIFIDEDEKRGMQCLYGIESCQYDRRGYDISKSDLLVNESWHIRLTTYENLLMQILKNIQLKGLNIESPLRVCDRKDIKVTVFLSELAKRGVQCFCLYSEENAVTDYWVNLNKEIKEDINRNPISPTSPWSKGMGDQDFYGELCQLEDYKTETAQKEIFYGVRSFEVKQNISGKYFNAHERKRKTCFQPGEYAGTIYILGLCTLVGLHVEDQYTIASFLQKELQECGYNYRVENYGVAARFDSEIEYRLSEIGKYKKNDIVICQSRLGGAIDIEGISLEHIYEKHNVSAKWIMDTYGHCNHIVNQLIAKDILEKVSPYLENDISTGEMDLIQVDFESTMKNYVQKTYLNQYFGDFAGNNYGTVGSIVMNCNPFHKGHRYLIEQASKQVEFLIIFVIEEVDFPFPFEERFQMIVEGTKDLSNIMVVPNGEFVFSNNNFKEYYTQEYNIVAALNAEYDVNVFANYIAKALHITHRFTGKGTKGRIKKTYNEAMKKILPQKGITFVEIPRLILNGEAVDTSQMQKFLNEGKYDKVFERVTDSTKAYLRNQM